MTDPLASTQLQQPVPNWGNTHSDDCPLTQGRIELWAEFTQALHLPGTPHTMEFIQAMSNRDCLWGAVIEYTAGGNEDTEQCECSTHRTPEQIEAIQLYRNEHPTERN